MKNYFSDEELACQHCGKLEFNEEFRAVLNEIREDVGFPMAISSGYRCPKHPIEARKKIPGEHSDGDAVDVAVSYAHSLLLLESMVKHGIRRIGVNQKGDTSQRFIHIGYSRRLPPALWSY